jgi:peptidoglycan/xylan/chitin deacetylase (PgdA/CDA1 family)
MSVAPEDFAAQCAWLAERRAVVPLLEGIRRMDRSGRLPRGTVSLTFDDGFSSLYDYALPVLSRHAFPATVFLVAQTLIPSGQRVDWVDIPPMYELETLDINQVREMQAAGVRFESHSYSHADLTTLSFEDCVRDLRDSRELLESLLGHPVTLLAYPRGRHNQAVRSAAQRAGYSHAFTLPEAKEPTGPYAVPRVGVYRGNSLMELRMKSARRYLDLRTGPAYELLRRGRRATAGTRR